MKNKEKIYLYHVYMLKCCDSSYYVGIAKNVDKRLSEHRTNKKRGSKYVRSRLPVELVYKTPPMEHKSALYCERQLKKLSHNDKKEIAKFYAFLNEFSKSQNHSREELGKAYEKFYKDSSNS